MAEMRGQTGLEDRVFDLPHYRRDSGGPPEPVSLAAVAPQWNALISRERRPIGMRLELRPAARVACAPLPLSALLDSVLAGFLAEGATEFPHGLVLLAPIGFAVDASLSAWTAPRNVLLEVAQRELDDDERVRLLFEIQRNGVRLALRLEQAPTPAPERLKLFQYVLVSDGHILPPATSWIRLLPPSMPAVTRAFEVGAQAVVGWPLAPDPARQPRGLQPMQRAVLEVIRLVQADANVPDVERAFKAEPVLAYMLLTLANSPAFMPGRSISSLHQAIAMLGYARLIKWLVLLLVIASKDGNAMPLVYTAVVRGFAMEYLEAAAGELRARQDEGFVIGAFSLLDAITGQSLPELLSELTLPDVISRTLLRRDGPHAPYFDRLLALEGQLPAASGSDPAGALELPGEAINAALLQALAATDALLALI
jgi:hypothetical protein